MTTYLGFLMNRTNREEFVAPVVVDELLEARRELFKAYPESRFALLTVYTRAELEHVLGSVDRWPGLPSKVQDKVTGPLEVRSAPVRVETGGLPKLPQQVQATVEPVETITQNALPGWMQSFVQQAAPAPQAVPVQQLQQAKPVDAMEQMMAEQHPAAAAQSLIERLQMVRGESVAMPAMRREPELEIRESTITRNPGGPSVIDILKGMRK